jgi:hypothetical protein
VVDVPGIKNEGQREADDRDEADHSYSLTRFQVCRLIYSGFRYQPVTGRVFSSERTEGKTTMAKKQRIATHKLFLFGAIGLLIGITALIILTALLVTGH